jgi:hypothetical protein
LMHGDDPDTATIPEQPPLPLLDHIPQDYRKHIQRIACRTGATGSAWFPFLTRDLRGGLPMLRSVELKTFYFLEEHCQDIMDDFTKATFIAGNYDVSLGTYFINQLRNIVSTAPMLDSRLRSLDLTMAVGISDFSLVRKTGSAAPPEISHSNTLPEGIITESDIDGYIPDKEVADQVMVCLTDHCDLTSSLIDP